jgi:hypothetical protein
MGRQAQLDQGVGAARERAEAHGAGGLKPGRGPISKLLFLLKTKTAPKLAPFCTVAQRLCIFSQTSFRACLDAKKFGNMDTVAFSLLFDN